MKNTSRKFKTSKSTFSKQLLILPVFIRITASEWNNNSEINPSDMLYAENTFEGNLDSIIYGGRRKY